MSVTEMSITKVSFTKMSWILINQHSQEYLCFTNIVFWNPNSAPIYASRKHSYYTVHMEWG